MGVTHEDLAGKLLTKCPFLAACLLDAKNAGLRQAAQDALAKALEVENKLEVLFAPAADDANTEKVKAAEEALKQQIDKAAFSQETASCPPQSEIDTINVNDYRSLKKINIYAKWTLSSLIVAGFFLVLLAQYWQEPVKAGVTPEAKEQLALLIGALIAAFTSVVQYFFGSSVGSAEKTLLMQNKEPGAAGPAQPGKTG